METYCISCKKKYCKQKFKCQKTKQLCCSKKKLTFIKNQELSND